MIAHRLVSTDPGRHIQIPIHTQHTCAHKINTHVNIHTKRGRDAISGPQELLDRSAISWGAPLWQ